MNYGIVFVGRNEASRLLHTIPSYLKLKCPLIYVDSGSVDNSIQIIQKNNIDYIEINEPYSAAKARNKGFEYLTKKYSDIQYIMFVDSDCSVEEEWCLSAVSTLENEDELGIVCGSTVESYPEKSKYNILCHLEWQKITGEISATGGIFMIKKHVFNKVNGFNENLSCGEEADLCAKVLQLDKKIKKMEGVMCYHDAQIYTFSKWAKRCVRGGYAVGLGIKYYPEIAKKESIRSCIKILLWNFIYFLMLVFLFFQNFVLFGLLFLMIMVSITKTVKFRQNTFQNSFDDSFIYALFTKIDKPFMGFGFIKSILDNKSKLIEYK